MEMANKNISDKKLHAGANKAIKEAVRGVLEEHKRLGEPVVIWRDGKIAKVPASQLLRKRGSARRFGRRPFHRSINKA